MYDAAADADSSAATVAPVAAARPQRDLAIDALRGLAIVAVVLGHAIVQAGELAAGGPGRMEFHPGIWLTLSTRPTRS